MHLDTLTFYKRVTEAGASGRNRVQKLTQVGSSFGTVAWESEVSTDGVRVVRETRLTATAPKRPWHVDDMVVAWDGNQYAADGSNSARGDFYVTFDMERIADLELNSP